MSNVRLAIAISLALGATAAGDSLAAGPHTTGNPWHVDKQAYIVQAASAGLASDDVRQVGGAVSRDLGIIRSVEAQLTQRQASELKTMASVHVFKDRKLGTEGLALTTALGQTLSATLNVVTTGKAATSDGEAVSTPTLLYQANFPALVGADSLQNQGITGKGVTVAILDTGLYKDPMQNFGSRVLASVDLLNSSKAVTSDPYGHGTHITSIAAGGAANLYGNYLGIAPQANLVIVRAFDGEGSGKYSDVIAGLNWIVANQAKYKIRVVNLSFGAPPESYYWDDPLNQAVMQAWRAGIVVVAAAGNEGPDPMSIGVPGNVPYVITTGALTDNNTPYNASDDKLASFSSTGPTFEGFVKPEMVAPGGHMVASMPSNSYLANIDPHSMNPGQQLFTMSGTSQAAAVTTGVVALMLQVNPGLSPDQVKCKLMYSARPAVTGAGSLAYSVFQQGTGLINAAAAVKSTASNCANLGLDINADLAGTAHFGGPANVDANGHYYIMNMSNGGQAQPGDGLSWSSAYSGSSGYSWNQGYSWSQGYTWSRGYTWSNGYTWSRGFTWSRGYTWSRGVDWWNGDGVPSSSRAGAIVPWVPNE